MIDDYLHLARRHVEVHVGHVPRCGNAQDLAAEIAVLHPFKARLATFLMPRSVTHHTHKEDSALHHRRASRIPNRVHECQYAAATGSIARRSGGRSFAYRRWPVRRRCDGSREPPRPTPGRAPRYRIIAPQSTRGTLHARHYS